LKQFSGIEQQIIKILKRRRQSTFAEIADIIYKDDAKPIHATTVISGN
jgi:predicted transcriptional regulator